MANYDRRILVPYLQDICFAEMNCAQLEDKISDSMEHIEELREILGITGPGMVEPNPNNYAYPGDWVQDAKYILGGGFGLIISLFFVDMFSWIAWIFAIISGLALILGLIFCISSNSEKNQAYEADMQKYNDYLDSIPMFEEDFEESVNHFSNLRKQYEKAIALRESLYDVNVIPKRYRNIHAAYYLFDFFSTCRETDLEKTIQTMLLDDIIQRLDELIQQNSEILMNQRRQIALQEQMNQTIAENHRQEMLQLASMERNQELQLDYQRMIAGNQMVTNYILYEVGKEVQKH